MREEENMQNMPTMNWANPDPLLGSFYEQFLGGVPALESSDDEK